MEALQSSNVKMYAANYVSINKAPEYGIIGSPLEQWRLRHSDSSGLTESSIITI